MPDMFIPSSPQDYPIRPVMKGMISLTSPTQSPDGSFRLVRNMDVTVRGMRRVGGWTLGLYTNNATPLAIPFHYSNESPVDFFLLALADGTYKNVVITNKFLYTFDVSLGYERVPWFRSSFTIGAVDTVSGNTAISFNEDLTDAHFAANDVVYISSLGTYATVQAVSIVGSTTQLILNSLLSPAPTVGDTVIIYKPFYDSTSILIDFCIARNKVYLVDGNSPLVFEYDGSTLLPLIITDDMGNQTVMAPETVAFFGERLYFGNVAEGYQGSVTAYYRNRIRWTDVLDFSKSPGSYYQDVSKKQGRVFKLFGLGPLLLAYTPNDVFYARPTNLTNLPYSFNQLETGGISAVGPKAITSFMGGQVFVSKDNVYYVDTELNVRPLADAISYDLRMSQVAPIYTYCRLDSKQNRLLVGTSEVPLISNKLFVLDITSKGWSVYENIPLVAPSLLMFGKIWHWSDVPPTDTWANSSLSNLLWSTVLVGEAKPALVAFQVDGYLLVYDDSVSVNVVAESGNVVWRSSPVRIETPDYDLGATDTLKTGLRLSLKIYERPIDRASRIVPIFLQLSGSTDGGLTWKQLGILRIDPNKTEDALNFRITGSTLRFRLDSIVPENMVEADVPPYEIVEMSIRLRDRSVEVFRGNVRPSS